MGKQRVFLRFKTEDFFHIFADNYDVLWLSFFDNVFCVIVPRHSNYSMTLGWVFLYFASIKTYYTGIQQPDAFLFHLF